MVCEAEAAGPVELRQHTSDFHHAGGQKSFLPDAVQEKKQLLTGVYSCVWLSLPQQQTGLPVQMIFL